MNTTPPGLPEYGGLSDVLGDIVRRLEALERAARLTHSSVGSGGLRVHSGGKITIEDETGSPRVVLDSSGLAVDGGEVLAVHVDIKEAGNPVNIDGDETELATATFTLPAWVATARVLAAATVRGANSTDDPLMVVCEARINHVFDGASGSTAADHATVTVVHFDERTIDTAVDGHTVTVSVYGYLQTGGETQIGGFANVWGLVIGHAVDPTP